MKAPIDLPFGRRGEALPASGVRPQAILGFLLPILLVVLAGVIASFMIAARLDRNTATGAAAALRAIATAS